jgi:hypothetical protein
MHDKMRVEISELQSAVQAQKEAFDTELRQTEEQWKSAVEQERKR